MWVRVSEAIAGKLMYGKCIKTLEEKCKDGKTLPFRCFSEKYWKDFYTLTRNSVVKSDCKIHFHRMSD